MPPTESAPACKAAVAAATTAVGSQKPWLFVGLGNPGRMYKGTRHNIGFEMIDAIAEAEGISVSSKQFKAKVGKGLIGDVPVMLAKPQTYMNASGESVSTVTPVAFDTTTLVSPLLIDNYAGWTAGFYFKIPLDQLVVVNVVLDLVYFYYVYNLFRVP
ncbi:hypothetical protein PR202_gb02012 [Eleusine coracana subsp. coracana]|uniref:Peptidyl-tRNA hydrolase n=1 Tax=Eleusine coracana subsp. coracana TaxID=191504 RepID=A0AAV5DXS2_ELECO|nr:hypothetical protein PR202_gb02012 [Eleusine coracana subsp. coracana]